VLLLSNKEEFFFEKAAAKIWVVYNSTTVNPHEHLVIIGRTIG